jgi:hypothetical protein
MIGSSFRLLERWNALDFREREVAYVISFGGKLVRAHLGPRNRGTIGV